MHPVLRFLIIPALAGLTVGFLAAKTHISPLVAVTFAALTAILAAIIPSALLPLVEGLAGGGRPVVYRKRRGQNTWHLCPRCSTWPTEDYETQPREPATGEICNECQLRFISHDCI
jgi:hypothetical protein